MGKLLTNIEQEEKNRILEMYGIKKTIISEQLDPIPPAGSTIKFKRRTGSTTFTGKILSTSGNTLTIKKTSPPPEIVDTFTKVDSRTMKLGSIMFDVISVTPPTTPRPTPRRPITIPVPKELVTQRINFFACPDYDANISDKALDSILITKLEEIFADEIIGDEMQDRVGSYIKLTTNRKLVGGQPLIMYFICGYEGFATNHDGTSLDDLNVVLSKYENGRFAEKCGSQLTIDRTPAQNDQQKKIDRILNQPNIPPVPPVPNIPPIKEENNPDGIPTRVFSKTLYNFLTQKYCGKSWSQNRPQDDTTGNV